MFDRKLFIIIVLCLFLAQQLDPVVGYGVQEQLWLEVVHPSDVAFAYKIRPARNFGDIISTPYRNIKLVATKPEEGCSHISNGVQLKGQVAFIKRGSCSFVSKAINAELYGAVAIVIADNDPNENTSWIDMIGDGTLRENEIGIPAFFMQGKDGRTRSTLRIGTLCDNGQTKNSTKLRENFPALYLTRRMISESLQRHEIQSALINIPVNFTNAATIHQPPWDFW